MGSVSDGKCSENLNSVIASIWKIPYFEENKIQSEKINKLT